MKPSGAIAIAITLCLSSCAWWHSTDLTQTGSGNPTLTRSVKGFGLWLNIHTGFEWLSGDALEKSSIRLHGARDHYTESEFDIVDWDGNPVSHNQDKKGTVTFDRKSHTVVIAIYINGRPFDANGRHSYREKHA
jgi:hypothetical protein